MNADATPPGQEPVTETAEDLELADALEVYLADLEAGRPVDPDRVQAEHPAIASRLCACLASMHAVARESEALGVSRPAVPLPGAAGRLLGDYRLLREIGRGGMGVVYEAEQVSLARRVAVKVLPFASTLDPRQLQRFQREAMAAAQLRHPHIVPIFAVGSEQDIHFYAMQFIEGRTLTAFLHKDEGIPSVPVPPSLSSQPAGTSLITLPASATAAPCPADPAPAPRRPAVDCRALARLALQAAEALDHAHQQGVIHRDVKPANLLVDRHGHLWITDFGLAQLHGDSPLTQTGDVVGTLRYMSPEQAAARRGLIDHRTDIYALGATLYEMLCGKPPFEGLDRGQLLLHIAVQEPRAVRRLVPTVPVDLETIVHKALAKDPAERYSTAQDFADDLRRFLEDQPISARPPTLSQRTSRWVWRHRTMATATVLFLVLALLGLAVAVGFIWQAQRQTAEALHQAQSARDEAQAALDRERLTASRHAIALAEREWQDGSTGRVEEILDTCLPELRGWEWRYLKRLCHADLLTLHSQNSSMPCLALSADGRLLAYVADRAVKIREIATGREIATLRGHQSGIPRVAFTPDGRRLVSGENSGVLRIWEVTDGTLVQTIHSPGGKLQDVAWDRDGLLLASADEDSTVRIWDARTGDEKLALRGHTQEIRSVAFAPAGPRRLLAAADNSGTVKLWDTATGAEVSSLRGMRSLVKDVVFSPDGRRLAFSSGMEGIVVDTATGKVDYRLRGHTNQCYRLAFSGDGRRLASTGYDRTVRLWDTTNGALLRTLRWHSGSVFGVALSFDGQRVWSCGQDGSLKVWDATAGEQPHYLRGHTGFVSGVSFHPDGSLLASAAYDGTVKLWDVRTLQEQRTLRGHAKQVQHVRFSPDGRALASADHDGGVIIWDSTTGEKLHLLAFTGSGLQTAFSPDGRTLAVAGRVQTGDRQQTVVILWDVATGRQLGERRGKLQSAFLPDGSGGAGVGFSPDGRYLAWSSGDGLIRVEEMASGREVLHCRGVNGSTGTLGFSGDGRRLTAPGKGNDGCVWDVVPSAVEPEVRDPQLILRGHTTRLMDVSFSPDGRRLVTSGRDGLVKLWDARDGAELLSLHLEAMETVFSRDGNLLAVANVDNSVLLCNGTPLPASP